MNDQSMEQGGTCFSNGLQTNDAFSKRPELKQACATARDHGNLVRPRFEMIRQMIKKRETNTYKSFLHSGPSKQMPSSMEKQLTCAPAQQSFSARENGLVSSAAKEKQWMVEQSRSSRRRQDNKSSTCSLSNQTGIKQTNGSTPYSGQDLQMQNTRYCGNSTAKLNTTLECYNPFQQRPLLPNPQGRDISKFSPNLGLPSLHLPSPFNPGDLQQIGITSYSNPVPHQLQQDFQQTMFAANQHLQRQQQQLSLMINTSSSAKNQYFSTQDPLAAHYEVSSQDRIEQGLRGQLRAYEEEIQRLKKEDPFLMVMDSISMLQNVLRERQKHQHVLRDNVLRRSLQLLGSATGAQNGAGANTLSSPLAKDQAPLLAPPATGLSTSILDSVLREGGDIRRRLAAGAKISREILRKYTAACQEMMLPFNLERLVSLACELERLQESSAEEDLAAVTPPAGAGLDYTHQLRQAIAWKVKYEVAQQRVADASERVMAVHSLYASSLKTARPFPPPSHTTTPHDLSSPDLGSTLGPCFAGENNMIDSKSIAKECTQILPMSSYEKKKSSRQKRSSKNGGQTCSEEEAERLELENHQQALDSTTSNGCSESTSTHWDAAKQVTFDNGSFLAVREPEEGVNSSSSSPLPNPAETKVLLGLLLRELEKCSWKTRRVQLHDALVFELEHARKSTTVHRAVRCAMDEVQRRIDKIHKVEEIVLFIDTRQLSEQQPQSDDSSRLSLLDFVSRSQNSVPDHVKSAVVGDVLRELQDFHCRCGSAAYKLLHPVNIIVEDCFKLRHVTHATNIEPLPPWRFLAPELRGACEDRVASDTKTLSLSSTTEPSGEPAADRNNSGDSADIYSLGQVVLWLSCLGRPSESLSESLMLSYDEIPVLKDMLSSDPSKRPTIESLLKCKWFGSDVMDQTNVLKEKKTTVLTHDAESPATEDGDLKRGSAKKRKSENTLNKSSTGKTVNGYRVITNTGFGHIDNHINDNCEDHSGAVGLIAGPATSVPCKPEFVSEGYRVKIREEEEAIMNEMCSDDSDDYAEPSQQNSSANNVLTEKRICEVKTGDFRNSETGENKPPVLEGIVTDNEDFEMSADHPFAPLSDTAQLADQVSSINDNCSSARPINSRPAVNQIDLTVSSAPALSQPSDSKHMSKNAPLDIAHSPGERSAVPRDEACFKTPRPVIGQLVNQLDSFELNEDELSILGDLEDSVTESCVDDEPEELCEEPKQTEGCRTASGLECSGGTVMPVVEQCAASNVMIESHVPNIDNPNIFGNEHSLSADRVDSCKVTIDRQSEAVCTDQDDLDASISVKDTANQISGGEVTVDQCQKDSVTDRGHLAQESTFVASPSSDNSNGGARLSASGKQLIKCPLGRPALGSLRHGSSSTPAHNKPFVFQRGLGQQPLQTINANPRIPLSKIQVAVGTVGDCEPPGYDPFSTSVCESPGYEHSPANGCEPPGYNHVSTSVGESPVYEYPSDSGYGASLNCEKQLDNCVNDPVERTVKRRYDDSVVDCNQNSRSDPYWFAVDTDKTSGPDVGQFTWSEEQNGSTRNGDDFVCHHNQDDSVGDSDGARLLNHVADEHERCKIGDDGHSVVAGESRQIKTSVRERPFDVGRHCQVEAGVHVLGVSVNNRIEFGVQRGSYDDQFGGVLFSTTGREALQEEEDILLEMEDCDQPSLEALASGDPDEILLILDESSN